MESNFYGKFGIQLFLRISVINFYKVYKIATKIYMHANYYILVSYARIRKGIKFLSKTWYSFSRISVINVLIVYKITTKIYI